MLGLCARTRHTTDQFSVNRTIYPMNGIVLDVLERPELTGPFSRFELKRCVRWNH